jgi:CheY-like chemotaxis protein
LDRPDQKDRLMLVFESLRELLFDVVKHAQVDRATVDLALTPDDQLQITVADRGVGFDPTAALAQASTTSGWGLFRIRERADLLGGSLQIASVPGDGSRFVFTIPRSDGTPAPRRTLRVLIADDHVVARTGLRELLAARPELEIVGEATTGTEAVVQAEALRPDAVIMDVSMPGLDGVDATRLIHAAHPAVKIFGLSSHTESADAVRAAGAVGYFTKGDDPQLLIDCLLALHAALASTPAG